MMARLAIICMTPLLILATDLQRGKLGRLHSVETYEIRPGILVIPTYSGAGEVCSIVLEKRHVSSGSIDLDAEMSREDIYGIFDELAPGSERGQSKLNLKDGGDLTLVDGGTFTTIAEYENVSIQMHGKSKELAPEHYVAAVIKWKKQTCKPDQR
jgi:hypothetical protein